MIIDTFMGIDPGQGGAIAYYTEKDGIKVVKMPKDAERMLEYFRYLKTILNNPVVFLERVSAYMSDSNPENNGKQFRINVMLANYERLKVCLVHSGFRFIETSPITWQKTLNLRKDGEDYNERKARFKLAASKYYPSIKSTLWNADALCLVQFGRTKYHTDPNWIEQRLPEPTQTKMF